MQAAQQHSKSWMLPEAKPKNLIYATGACLGTCVFSYPGGKVVGSLTVAGDGACADVHGNVFITNDNTIDEYAHGGTSPIAVLNLPGNAAIGCSRDVATGNLAVALEASGGDIAVFPNATGTPVVFNTGIGASWCAYDNSGSLFASGIGDGPSLALAELPIGNTRFLPIAISQSLGQPGQLQWDGSYITWEGIGRGDISVSRLSIYGSEATTIGTTHFNIGGKATQSWIDGSHIFIPFANGHQGKPTRVGIWRYPKGGSPTKTIKDFDGYDQFRNIQAVTFSTK
jgi:hypothetical protein